MLNKNKIIKHSAFLIVMMATFVSYAHQPDLSTSVLSKTDEGIYVLQITSSLSAFEGEIDYLYSKSAYKTPEDFKKLVVDHFRKNVLFITNEKDTLKFGQPLVLLGHETKLIVEVLNMPKDIKSLYYKNTVFKDMPHNQMAVIMLTDGFPKEQYVLENENSQTIQLELNEGKWVSKISEFKFKNSLYILLFLVLLFIPVYYLGIKKQDKK